ncbi:reverse transcriptase domain-containing protein [Tanacetum coccineum]
MAEDISTQVKINRPSDTLVEGESMEVQEATETKAPKNLRTETDIWKLYTDGASNEHGSRAGLILIDLEGAEYSYTLRLNFANSNNDAEYEALLAGLRIATKMKVERMHAFVDLKLVANQVEGSYEAKGQKTKKYKEKVLEIIRSFSNFRISHIPREENRKADALSKVAAVQCEGLTKGNQNKTTSGRRSMGRRVANVLWAHRLTPKTSNRETPFSLAYGTEAVIHAEIGIPTRRTIQASDEENEEALGMNLNLLEERREITTIREARRKQQVEKYYNQRVHHKQFKVGEFVLHKNKLSKVGNTGKLRPKWKGPYEVVETYGTCAYKLRSMDGAEIPRTWHFSNLRKYYM